MTKSIAKVILMVAMTLNHIAFVFSPPEPLRTVFLTVGMICMPIYAYWLAEGYLLTHNRLRFGVRLGVLALISGIPFRLVFGRPFPSTSVMYTLFVSFVCLAVLESVKVVQLRVLVITALVGITIFGDWGLCAPLWVLAFYCFRGNLRWQLVSFSLIGTGYLAYSLPITRAYHILGIFLAIPLLLLYNHKQGRLPKILRLAFYFYYPLHLTILFLLKTMFGL